VARCECVTGGSFGCHQFDESSVGRASPVTRHGVIPAIKRPMHRGMASETLIVVAPHRVCVNEIIDGRAINGAIVIPSVVQLNQHVGLRGIVADFAYKTALGRFGARECVETDRSITIFDRDTFGRGKTRTYAWYCEQHHAEDRPCKS
jgi:hypothetical protein